MVLKSRTVVLAVTLALLTPSSVVAGDPNAAGQTPAGTETPPTVGSPVATLTHETSPRRPLRRLATIQQLLAAWRLPNRDACRASARPRPGQATAA